MGNFLILFHRWRDDKVPSRAMTESYPSGIGMKVLRIVE